MTVKYWIFEAERANMSPQQNPVLDRLPVEILQNIIATALPKCIDLVATNNSNGLAPCMERAMGMQLATGVETVRAHSRACARRLHQLYVPHKGDQTRSRPQSTGEKGAQRSTVLAG